MDVRYKICGGIPLQGEVTVSGSKNAALPLIAATLLITEEETVFTNVPDIRDVRSMINILEFLGADVTFEAGTLRISARDIKNRPLPGDLVSRFRASILLLGPLLARFGVVSMAYPGGCVLGKRSIDAHIAVFEQLGARNMSTEDTLHLQGTLTPTHITLPEFSVTATENAILAASILPGETRIDLAACEPHVQDLCRFLVKRGVTIAGTGSHVLCVRGVPSLFSSSPHRIIPDDLEIGVMVAAALTTRGTIVLQDVCKEHLVSFLEVVRRIGGQFSYDENTKKLRVDGAESRLKSVHIKTNIFPGFPTDLLPPMGVVLTQALGVTRLFERLYEGRMAYLYELEKMGAHVEFLNVHQALIIGPTELRGRIVASNDIRAGAAMVVAGLTADGETVITDVQYIERGYDRLHEKLQKLGANIERQEGESQGKNRNIRPVPLILRS
ncbi:UDP-N-acetylglucosamine 1-carboxyvinyltransferase [Candidatus Peregrinibacteria bacterium]|nr:UDP-N-acetylglucosamine 1-carboxyvinyltransferase [Candidatus Peregrinibacteria bacterium]